MEKGEARAREGKVLLVPVMNVYALDAVREYLTGEGFLR